MAHVYKHVQEIVRLPPVLFNMWPYSWRVPQFVAAKPGTCVKDWCIPIIVAGCLAICVEHPVQLFWGPADLLEECKHSVFAWLDLAGMAQMMSVFGNKMWGGPA